MHWCPDSSPMLPNDCVNMYQLIYVLIKTCVNSLQRKTAYHDDEVLFLVLHDKNSARCGSVLSAINCVCGNTLFSCASHLGIGCVGQFVLFSVLTSQSVVVFTVTY